MKEKIYFIKNETKTDVYVLGQDVSILSHTWAKIISKKANIKICKIGEIYYDTFDSQYNIKILKPVCLQTDTLNHMYNYLYSLNNKRVIKNA